MLRLSRLFAPTHRLAPNIHKQTFPTSLRHATTASTNRTPNAHSVPITTTVLSDGSTFVTRHSLSTPQSSLAAPLLSPPRPKKRLTNDEIAKMRQLRQDDPEKWTTSNLAKHFGCSRFFVSMKAPMAEEMKREMKNTREEAEENRPWRKKVVTDNKRRRKELW